MSNTKRDYEMSLLNDHLLAKGLSIVDVYGYISNEFGDPVFKLCRIALSDGTAVDVAGEHDLPYLYNDPEKFIYPEGELP